jgi:hypothetical protein
VKNKIILFFIVCFNLFDLLGAEQDYPHLVFHKSKDTLSTIIGLISNKTKGIYLRFGDGDINLALGQSELLQSHNDNLKQEMQEAFAINGVGVMKTLPLCCKELGGWENGMFPGNHEAPYSWCLNILDKARPLWKVEIQDVYSPVAIHFLATREPKGCIKFLKFLKNSNCCLLVGNRNIPDRIRKLLFGSNCQFVPTPPNQSYQEIDRIEKECLEKIPLTGEYKIIITAMGCSGRVLQKRL